MTGLHKLLITTSLFVVLQTYSFAQVTAIGADYSKQTSFLRGKPDMIHVFFSPLTGNLEAKHHSNENSDFIWEKLDVGTQTFSTVHSETGISVSSFGNLSDGGYRVVVDSAGEGVSIDTFAVWVIIDTFNLVGEIKYSSTCEWLDLDATVRPSANVPYRIRQFESQSSTFYDTIIYNKLTTDWTTSVDIYDGLPDIDDSWKKWNKTTIDGPAPLVDAVYSVTIKDVFGKTLTASTPLIPAIAVYPAFTVEARDENENWAATSGYASESNDALFRVRFKHNDSRHADKYIWKGYGDSRFAETRNLLIWSQTTTDLSETIYPVVPHHTGNLDGYPTGKYGFQLIIENTLTGCRDSTLMSYINVAGSSFQYKSIPNAFTPNGDGQNDIFRFIKGQEPKSMRTIKIQIFDRGGSKVYSYSGSYEKWKGWNGKVNNDGTECSSGVYYYVVSGTGWDDASYDGKEYRSFLHLFRD
ncbi:MAG: gliding motility-associated C-terminal domain-containing protein [Prevotellaceae bacterium]|jgi:gliding motility-associated-like protein|nr:gliding motility-associated C-terminal domain-containing protein [Prevotellaceae bacterium]